VEPRSGRLPNEQRRLYFESAVKRLQALPGLSAVTAATSPPIGGATSVGVGSNAYPVCPALASGSRPEPVAFNAVLPGYFEALGVRIVSGRDFLWTENDRTPAMIVNEAFAEQYFPNQNAVGAAVRAGFNCAQASTGAPIVGVAGDIRQGLRRAREPMVYFPLGGYTGTVTILARTTGEPRTMIPTIRRAMTELNASIPTFSEATFTSLRERSLRSEQLLFDLVTLFGSVTLVV
jgi:hypothetical protein